MSTIPVPHEVSVADLVLGHPKEYWITVLLYCIGVAIYVLWTIGGYMKDDHGHTLRQEIGEITQKVCLGVALCFLYTTGKIWVVLEMMGYNDIEPLSIAAMVSVAAGFFITFGGNRLLAWWAERKK